MTKLLAKLAAVIVLIMACYVFQPQYSPGKDWRRLPPIGKGVASDPDLGRLVFAFYAMNAVIEYSSGAGESDWAPAETWISPYWGGATHEPVVFIPPEPRPLRERIGIMTPDEFVEFISYDFSVGIGMIRDKANEVKTINSDNIGWIYIPGTMINYPIMYRADQESFYLSHDYTGKQSSGGSIFLDDALDGRWTGFNLLHGHSMRNGTMFRALFGYTDRDWAAANRNIYVFDGTYVLTYEVFAVIRINANNEGIQIRFGSDEERNAHLDDIRERSIWDSWEIQDYNEILVLSTCSYESRNFRTLVYSSLVEINGVPNEWE